MFIPYVVRASKMMTWGFRVGARRWADGRRWSSELIRLYELKDPGNKWVEPPFKWSLKLFERYFSQSSWSKCLELRTEPRFPALAGGSSA